VISEESSHETVASAPKPTLAVIDAVAIIVGIVVGVGIFRAPSMVAANVDNALGFLLVWPLGGLISLLGALCYAELATAYPHAGGEYHYLVRAFGREIGWLFAWARLTVTQTGSIALLAFVFGDYAAQLLPLGQYGTSLYAAMAVVGLTLLNAIGIQQSKWTQNLLTAAKLLGFLGVFWVGLRFTAAAPFPAESPQGSYGLAMIFVLLTYGGWSEAAYLSAELQQVQRNMARVLVGGISIISVIFLLTNLAYLQGLGLVAIARSDAVAADLMRRAWGDGGAAFISVLIAISALGAAHGTILTGARTHYAVGQDFSRFRQLGHWHPVTHTPVNALLLQSAIALGLVLLGTLTRSGFETMVDYTAPVFWCFLLLTVGSLFILRQKEPAVTRPFRVPLYPLTPLLFCAVAAYMLYASLRYTGFGALVGVAVLLAGLPVLLVLRLGQPD
jgi:amino acid transporter